MGISTIRTALILLVSMAVSVSLFGTASAGPVADVSRSTVTDDGWTVTVEKLAESVTPVPNLAATPFTREGFVSLKARGEISGDGTAPVNSGILTLGYQLGCQVDVSSGLGLGVTVGIGPSVGVTISQFPGVNLGLAGQVAPSVNTTLKPGTIATIPFGEKVLAGPVGSITAEEVHIKVDACMGPVSLRSYATVGVSTDTADNQVTVYGEPIYL